MTTWSDINLKLDRCFDGIKGDMEQLVGLCADQQQKLLRLEQENNVLRDIIKYNKEKENAGLSRRN